ncbi:paeninodin family lasso peptide [Paenibacillus sacheonensis]|uniref:Paeninodin family lasso peptide n=1 Tax=Paenibacillus sacheonensis TaxID=742054 RepID=A0A7X5BYP3_9BACL|nr:paeninodin family lasso peptide [Paenibacillus sacheonensis]MBM7567329.1 hypothetical protein [Paenibacillus sacheonensis]NBC69887.1 paeninodin family lasso peptide [Paenibacillus sacheonensis]
MAQAKKAWQQPVLETLEVRQTLEGKGVKYVDQVTPDDKDITDTPPVS